MFDNKVLDMTEVGVVNWKGMAEFKVRGDSHFLSAT